MSTIPTLATVVADNAADHAAERAGNAVDRLSRSADGALDATHRAANAAINRASDAVHGLRDRASPVLDRMASPFDSMANYTQQAPLKSLLVSAAVGAGLMALLSLFSRSDR